MLHRLILLLCLLTFACTPSLATTNSTLTSGDSELEAAIAQARGSLDEFITRIATAHANRTFVALKVRFTPPGESPQDIWVAKGLPCIEQAALAPAHPKSNIPLTPRKQFDDAVLL